MAIISIVSDTPIPAGNRWLLSLDATVPDNAPYGSSEILTVIVDSINAAAPAATRIDEAVQLVGFPEDNSPLFIDLQQAGLVASGLPILSSSSAHRPEFDPTTKATDAAVATWEGTNHAPAPANKK